MNEAMKQSLSEKAVEILTQIQGAVVSGAKLGTEQLPDIAQQFVQYTIVSSIMSIIIGFALLGVTKYLINLTIAWAKDDDEGCLVSGSAAIATAVFGAGNIFFNIQPLIMALAAPKVLVIKELLSVIK